MALSRFAPPKDGEPPGRRPIVTGIHPVHAIILTQLAAIYLIVGSFLTLTGSDGLNRSGNILGLDFITFYAASELVLEGPAEAVYDFDTLHRTETAVFDIVVGDLPWLYPPTFLLVVAPFAELPYTWSLALWLGLTLALLLYVAYRIAPSVWAPALVLLFPAVGNSLFSGQNASLSAALLGAGLICLERRPWLAGVLFGLLSYKPQLGLLVPIALIAAGHWRTFTSAAATTVIFAAVSGIAFGVSPWLAFFESADVARNLFEDSAEALEKMPTLFALARLSGADLASAYGIQVVGTIGVAAFVYRLWRMPARREIKYAGLIAAIPLSTPFVWHYDLAILAPALIWWCLDIRDHGWLKGEKLLLTLLWIAPVALLALSFWLNIHLWQILLIAALAFLWRRTWKAASGVATQVA